MGRRPKSEINVLDIDQLISQIIDSGIDPNSLDADLDVPRAKNVIDFALSPEFRNDQLWAKQAEQVVKLFAEWCPGCTDPNYIKNVPVDSSMGEFQDRVALLEFGTCPRCGLNKRELFDTIPYEIVSCLGQRSGKSSLTGGVIAPYILHRFLLIPNPTRYFGVLNNSAFDMSFVARSIEQVKDSIWSYFTGAIKASPWFHTYHKALDEQEKRLGLKKGSLYKVMDTYVWYGNKRIKAFFQASVAETLRGATRISAAIDELGMFNIVNTKGGSNYKHANAEETYTSLMNSLRTTRQRADELWESGDYNPLPGYMLNIGSPMSQYDKMMSLLKEGERDTRKVTFHLATWEVSPKYKRTSFASEEMSNRIRFLRDFGAIPPLADSPFIGNERAIYNCNSLHTPLFRARTVYVSDKASEGKYIGANLYECSLEKQTSRIITCDAGESNNHFAISMHHIEPINGVDDIKLIMDGAIEVAPEKIIEKEEKIPVHFPTMLDVVEKLCERFNVKVVVFDRWSSIGESQRLRDKGILSERYSPKYQDFIDLRNTIEAGNYSVPAWEHKKLEDLDLTNLEDVKRSIYTHCAVQLATVKEAGKKLLKPDFGEDDIFRTIVLASVYFRRKEWKQLCLSTGIGTVINKKGGISVVKFSNRNSGNNYNTTRTSIAVVKTRNKRY